MLFQGLLYIKGWVYTFMAKGKKFQSVGAAILKCILTMLFAGISCVCRAADLGRPSSGEWRGEARPGDVERCRHQYIQPVSVRKGEKKTFVNTHRDRLPMFHRLLKMAATDTFWSTFNRVLPPGCWTYVHVIKISSQGSMMCVQLLKNITGTYLTPIWVAVSCTEIHRTWFMHTNIYYWNSDLMLWDSLYSMPLRLCISLAPTLSIGCSSANRKQEYWRKQTHQVELSDCFQRDPML